LQQQRFRLVVGVMREQHVVHAMLARQRRQRVVARRTCGGLDAVVLAVHVHVADGEADVAFRARLATERRPRVGLDG